MKRIPILLALLLLLGTVNLILTANTAYAVHNAEVKVTPVFYNGGGELKNFSVTNLPESTHGIIEVVITFPTIHEGDTEYKPVDYTFPDGWMATYEPALRQVTFKCIVADNSIEPDHRGFFTINFTEGPYVEDEYEWIVSTTDSNKDAHTYYPVQTIDRTNPTVVIEQPVNNSIVYGIWEGTPPTDHYFWINVTAIDRLAGISAVKIRLSNSTWQSSWIDITSNKAGDLYYYKWYNLVEGKYIVTAWTADRAGNEASTWHSFEYKVKRTGLRIIWDSYAPYNDKKGTVGPTTTVNPESGLAEGSIYTYGGKTLGTTVKVEGLEFTPNSNVNITVEGVPYGTPLLVAKNRTDSAGGFTASFVFPTAPYGSYRIYAKDTGGRFDDDWFTVIPEIIYKPVVIIGPAPIEAIATGLPSYRYVSGFTCNDTDALLSVNWHVIGYYERGWYTDENGTLRTDWADKPGFLMPVLEPGTYEIGLDFGYYAAIATENYDEYFSISNYVYVVNDFKELSDKLDELELKLDYIKPKIDAINDNVATIKTDVGTIKTDVKDIIEDITVVKGDVAEIKTKVGTIIGYVEDINWNDVIAIKTDVGTIKGRVEAINWNDVLTTKSDVATIKTDVGDIKVNVSDVKSKLEEVPTTLGINIVAVLSAIAAIASIISVVVVMRRLKVAG